MTEDTRNPKKVQPLRRPAGSGAATGLWSLCGHRVPPAFFVLGLPLLAGCLDWEPPEDPLRIPWETAGPHLRQPEPAPTVPSTATPDERRPEDAGRETVRDGAAGCVGTGCHDDFAGLANRTDIHARVAAVSCERCHVPAGPPAEHAFRLVEYDGAVCRSCHPSRPSKKSVHVPFREGRCLSCHEPHGRSTEKLLAHPDEARVCGQCHEPRRDAVVHGPYAAEDCGACHHPHESDHRSLAREASADLCLGCHDREIVSDDGRRVLADIAGVIRSSRFRHGPVREGECFGCHDAHASANANLLHKAFPAEFYQSYDDSRYALCFQCHETGLVVQERTATLTGFRDGDRNLHHLHVYKEKGRSCRACHDVHASGLPFHMRENVLYGEERWKLPLNFRRTENGGTCTPGCHQATEYDREAGGP